MLGGGEHLSNLGILGMIPARCTPACGPSLLDLVPFPPFRLGRWPHLVDSTSIAVYIGVLERVDTPLPEYLGVVLVKNKTKKTTKKENQGFCYLALFIWLGRAPPCQASCWGLGNQGDFWTKSDNCSRYSDVWPLAAGHFIPKLQPACSGEPKVWSLYLVRVLLRHRTNRMPVCICV